MIFRDIGGPVIQAGDSKLTKSRLPKIFITGGRGLLGSALVQALRDEAYVQSAVRVGSGPVLPGQIEVNTDSFEEMRSAIAHFSPDIVVHNAASASLSGDPAAAKATITSNILLSNDYLRACSEVGGIHFVNCDSYSAYDQYGNESALHAYGISKNIVRQTAKLFAMTGAIKVTNVILYDIFSELDIRPNKIFNRVISALNAHNPVALTAGEQQISFVHVSDVIAAFKKIIFSSTTDGYVSTGVLGPEVKSLKSYFNDALIGDDRKSLLKFGDYVDPRPQPKTIFVSQRGPGDYEASVFFGEWLKQQLL